MLVFLVVAMAAQSPVSPEQQLADAVAQMEQKLGAMETRLTTEVEHISRDDPAYANLVGGLIEIAWPSCASTAIFGHYGSLAVSVETMTDAALGHCLNWKALYRTALENGAFADGTRGASLDVEARIVSMEADVRRSALATALGAKEDRERIERAADR